MSDWLSIIVAICLIATVIWAFKTEIQIPAPFAWVKGLAVFLMVLGACVLLWNIFVGNRFGRVHL